MEERGKKEEDSEQIYTLVSLDETQSHPEDDVRYCR